MTMTSLGELAARKTATARNEAVKRLEAMREAFQIIKQATQQAEHDFRLDVSGFDRANLPNKTVQHEDYLTALEIGKKATAVREEILRTANQAFETELISREQSKQREARGFGRPRSPERPSLGFCFSAGFSLTILSILLSCCMGLIEGPSLTTLTNREKESAATLAKLEIEYDATRQKMRVLEPPPKETPAALEKRAKELQDLKAVASKMEKDIQLGEGSAVAIARLRIERQSVLAKIRVLETPTPKETHAARSRRENELQDAKAAAAKLEKELQENRAKNQADKSALAKVKSEKGTSGIVTLLWFVLAIGWLGLLIVPGIFYSIWGLQCIATKARVKQFDDRMQESLIRLAAQEQKAQDALNLLATLGTVSATATHAKAQRRE